MPNSVKKAKIFLVIDSLGPGGAQRQMIEYLKCADRVSFDVSVINLDKGYDTLAPEINKLGYRIIGIEHAGFLNIGTLFRLVRLFKKEKPDIVHTILFTADVYGRLAAKITGVKAVICSIRGIDNWKKLHHILLDRVLAAWTDVITINAENSREFLVKNEKLDSSLIRVIYNGIDLKRFSFLRDPGAVRKSLGIPAEAIVIGMVSRFAEPKDYDTFLRSALEVGQANSDYCFMCVGDGPLKEGFVARISSGPLKGKVIFTGLRHDIPALINAMDICVLSSRHEGCPNVILEYMACSKPVVASNVGGCAELIVDGQTGFVVSAQEPHALAEKLFVLCKDKQLRQKMGQEGRKRVEDKFISEIMSINTENLYRSLLYPKIAFIFSQFPCYDETFILREMNSLVQHDINYTIYSIKPCRDKIIHPEAQKLHKKTVYLGLFSFSGLFVNLFYLLRYPIRYLSAYLAVTVSSLKSPNFFFKTQVLFPQAVHFACQAKRNNVIQVHGQWATYPATYAYIISKLNRIPYSFTGHAHDIYEDTTMLADKIMSARMVLTCTADNKRHLLSLCNSHFGSGSPTSEVGVNLADKIIVNYHGLNLEKFQANGRLDVAQGRLNILSVGSLLPSKGFNTLISACAILKEKNIDFQCVIAGGGKMEAQLRDQADTLKLAEHIKFTGYITQDKLLPLYQQADVFVLLMVPEDHWGIPNVLVEALAVKVPVICTLLGPIPELVTDGKTGIIVPPKDPEATAAAILRLYADPGLRKSIGEAGRRVVEEKFDVKKNSRRLANLFTCESNLQG